MKPGRPPNIQRTKIHTYTVDATGSGGPNSHEHRRIVLQPEGTGADQAALDIRWGNPDIFLGFTFLPFRGEDFQFDYLGSFLDSLLFAVLLVRLVLLLCIARHYLR